MLKFRKTLSLLVVLAMCAALLAACGSEPITSPQNLTYNQEDGTFSFDALEGAKTYIVGVSKIINNTTGEALAGINQSSVLTLADGSSVYLWSEQTGSVAGLADDDGDGVVSGKVIYREFSSSAETVGAVKKANELPVGRYVLQVVAAATDELPNPEPALYEFTVAGALANPSGFSASINGDGCIEITGTSDYYLSCLTETGLPEKMVFEVLDGGNVVETLEVADFSYTNTVIGPNKSFTFNNTKVTGTVKLDSNKHYTVRVTAKGDGDLIQDGVANAYTASVTPAVQFANKLSQTGYASVNGMTVSLELGTDGAGGKIYELTASASNTVVLRESGTYTASAEAAPDGKYANGTTLTFTASQSDLGTAVMNGVTLTVGEGDDSDYLYGAAKLDGADVEFTKKVVNQGGGGFPGGPGGGGMPGGSGGGGGAEWELAPEDTTFAEGAESFAFKIGSHVFYSTTAKLQASPSAGSTYTYVLEKGDPNAPFEVEMILELKADGTAELTVGSAGPISGGNCKGKWTAENGEIKLTW